MDDHEIARVEQAMNTALADDLELTYGKKVTILSYLIAAEVMDEEGTVTVMWTATDGVPSYRLWGLLEWLRRRFAHHTAED